MSKRLKNKAILLIAVEIISLIMMGCALVFTQNGLSIGNYKEDMKQEIKQLKTVLEEAQAEELDTIKTYDEIYKARAASVSFMANNDVNFAVSDVKMKEYKELLQVDNVLLIDPNGNVLAKAQNTLSDFSAARFNQLKSAFQTGTSPEAFEVEIEDQWYRYYGSKINNDMMVVIEENPEDLHALLQDTTSQESVLKNMSVGLDGYVFAVSAKNYLIEYHPDADLVGADALDAGVLVEDLEDNRFTWMEVNEKSIYSAISKVGDSYYISAIPESEIEASRNITVGVILFIFFAVMTIVITYGIFVKMEHETSEEEENRYHYCNKFKYNKAIGKKTLVLSLVGLVCIFVISFYMQTLFSLSRQSMSNDERVAEVERTMNTYAQKAEMLTEQYNERYLNKAQIAAYIVEQKPAIATDEKLDELANVLQIQYINVFNDNGTITATNSPYTKFTLSDNPKEQSYEFQRLLQGVEYFIQEAQTEELSGEFRQYIGVGTRDSEGDVSGFVQIGIRPSRLENILKNIQIENVLDGIHVGAKGFSFALDKDKGTFAYYPQEKLIGREATAYGMKEKQMKDGFSDYITIQDEKYYASSLETDDYFVYVAVPQSEMMVERMPLTIMAGTIGALCMLVIYLVLSFSRNDEEGKDVQGEEEEDDRMIDVQMPDGRIRRTESAKSRWMNISIDWEDKTSEQRIMTIVRWLFAFFAIVICIAVLWKENIFGQNSIFTYILSGKWERGLNVFALTGCILVICVVSTATMIVRKVLAILSSTFGARGETICRMLSSFLKYFSIVAMMYYCFAMFGVDTGTLLASAGIISIAISFGAKELVTDILCGLFIIFEGEFRVGDIIMIGDWRGTVAEIGIRTTKVVDGATNVKIIRNSAVSNVINMTKQYSFASCDVGIEYGESLERVEAVFEKEFTRIKEKFPAIKDGPFYKGVVSLGDNSVNVRIVAQCYEGDRVQLERDLMREMKLIFDKYEINIPFPQVVVNQPIEFKQATFKDKAASLKFTEEQRKFSQAIGNEEEEEK